MSINKASSFSHFNVITTKPTDINNYLESSADKKVDYLFLFNWGIRTYGEFFNHTEERPAWKIAIDVVIINGTFLTLAVPTWITLFAIDVLMMPFRCINASRYKSDYEVAPPNKCVSTENFQ